MNDQTARTALLALLEDTPNVTAAEAARRIGVSRERVRQLAQSEGIALSRYTRPPQARIILSSEQAAIHHTAAGAIAELLVAADLTARGWTVFAPIVRSKVLDLVAVSEDGRDVRRIEVRCGKRETSGGLRFNPKDGAGDIFDHLAIVVTGEPVIYRPDL